VLWLRLTGQKIAFGTTVLLLVCAERSSPEAGCGVEGAGLDGECADRATIIVAATREFVQRVRSIIDFYFVGFLSSALSGVSQPADLHDRDPRGTRHRPRK
jgi:hypothetical protein